LNSGTAEGLEVSGLVGGRRDGEDRDGFDGGGKDGLKTSSRGGDDLAGAVEAEEAQSE
tara:strand:+ start:193 stop:366 length:174 start_codon:yes stop_codon:yes gene_type:complete